MALFSTVAHAIAGIGPKFPDAGYVFQDDRGEEKFVAYPQVERITAARARGLQDLGLQRGDRLGLVVVDAEDFVFAFLAALRVGVIPVPLYPPMSFGALDAYADKTAKVLENAGAKVLLATSKLQHVLWSLVDRVPTLQKVVAIEDLRQARGEPSYPPVRPDDIAFLQYTSGSTADPKGVIVTHANLVANAECSVVHGLDAHGRMKAVGWLPLYHDMGLVGFVVSLLVTGCTAVLLPTMRFIRKPTIWLEAIHRHRGTVTFAPNFAYALITRKVSDAQLAEWDLSCVEAWGCGAEPIHPGTVQAFLERFAPAGVVPEAFLPAYGMAEHTLAITFKPRGTAVHTRRVDGAAFQDEGRVRAPQDDAPVLEHVSCGVPFPGHEVAVLDEDGHRLPEGREGELCMKGPSVCQGYWRAPEATRLAFRDGWLHSGDLGYVLDGEVYVTGRLKDLIIVNGRNLHPQAIEWRAAEEPGVRKGNVVAFAVTGADSEELVIVLETREHDHGAIADAVKKAVRSEFGVVPSDVVCLPPGSLPKTSSGKLQRRKTRQQYLDGALGQDGPRTMGSRGPATVVARHVLQSAWVRARVTLQGSEQR